MGAKQELRNAVIARMQTCDAQTRLIQSARVWSQLEQTEIYQQAQSVLCYWSMPEEVYTHDFIVEASSKKNLYLPVVFENKLLIRLFSGKEDLVKGSSFSIHEPHSLADEAKINEIDLAIVPGVAFDHTGARLGRGKGYYDRLLAGSHVYKIGICFDFQLVDKVPCDNHDIRMNLIITGS